MLLVSAGDVYGGNDAYNRPKCQFIARMMDRFGYDAVALGERDLDFGLDAVVEDNRAFGMGILCANVFRRGAPDSSRSGSGGSRAPVASAPVFASYRIVEKGGVRFGVIAALSPAAKNARVASQSGDVEALSYVIRDPLPILADLVPLVRSRSDVVVFLAHMDKSELEEIRAQVEGIDMVILGHSAKPQVTLEPVLVGGVPVYMASHQGQYLGRVVMSFDSHNRVVGARNEIRLLDSTVREDPEVAVLVEEFQQENRRYQKELFVREQLRSAGGAAEQDIYLGVANCQQCHGAAFDSYIQTKHARAYSTLSALFMHRDSGCVPCHSTGYGRPGGFAGRRMVGSPVDLVDVQCEACHGPGAEHTRDGRYRERARDVCLTCHTPEQDPAFSYPEAWEKIAH